MLKLNEKETEMKRIKEKMDIRDRQRRSNRQRSLKNETIEGN